MDLVRQSAKEEAKASLAREQMELHVKEHQQQMERLRRALEESEGRIAKMEREKREMGEKLEDLEVALKKKSTELERLQSMKKPEVPKKRPGSKK